MCAYIVQYSFIFEIVGLATSLGYGVASEIIRRSTATSDHGQQGSLMMTEANIKRLVSKLSQMRGAALKLGQFMSIQGLNVLTSSDGGVLTTMNQTRTYSHQK